MSLYLISLLFIRVPKNYAVMIFFNRQFIKKEVLIWLGIALYSGVSNCAFLFLLLFFQELKQKFAEQTQVNKRLPLRLFFFELVLKSVLLSFWHQALAEAQKSKEQALVESVS